MIDILLMLIGFIVFISSALCIRTMDYPSKIAWIPFFIGAALMIFGALLISSPSEDFCTEQSGEYTHSVNLRLCSISDSDGDYTVYKVIKIDNEYKLASFAGPEAKQ